MVEKLSEESKITCDSLLYVGRSLEGLFIKELTDSNTIREHLFFKNILCFALSKDYNLLAIADSNSIKLLHTNTYKIICEAKSEFSQELLISNTNKFLAVYQRHAPTKTSKILIFSINSLTKIKEIAYKRSDPFLENVKFSLDDELLLISPSKTEIQVFETKDLSKPIFNYTSSLIFSADIVPNTHIHPETKSNFISVIEQISGTDDCTAKFVPIKDPKSIKPIIKKFVLKKMDGAKTIFSPNGGAALFWGESQEDPTGKSYYGAHCLYYQQLVGGKKHCKVTVEGSTIHEAKWKNDGSEFIVVSGSQPAKVMVFNSECNPIYEMEAGFKNYAEFSQEGRFLMLGGFGNLAGDIEFWDLSDQKLIGNCKAHCTVSSEWSQNSKIIMTAVLNPRMRIDNMITFFDFTGKKLVSDSYEKTELYEVKWIKKRNCDEKVIDTSSIIAKKKIKPVIITDAKKPKENKKEQKKEEKVEIKKKENPIKRAFK